jgi:alanyl-tRNA synthetase
MGSGIPNIAHKSLSHTISYADKTTTTQNNKVMTKQLYLTNTYLFETAAEIIGQAADEKGTYILLDCTVFYPQGGGQPSDQGIIKGEGFKLNVLQVRQNENEIRHYIDFIPNTVLVGSKIICVLDEDRRILNARYHTAAHLLGNIVELIYPSLKATKGHSFPKEAYVEFQGDMVADYNEVTEALKEVISKNLVSKIFEIDPVSFEEKFYKLPYQIPSNKAFRVMQIGHLLPVPCGGTHLANTEEIGNIVLGKIKAKKSITRITYELI